MFGHNRVYTREMIKQAKGFLQEFKIDDSYNMFDIEVVYELGNKHLLLLDSDRGNLKRMRPIVDSWNKASHRNSLAIHVKHLNNFLKDSCLQNIYKEKKIIPIEKEINVKKYLNLYGKINKESKLQNFKEITQRPRDSNIIYFDGLGSKGVYPSDIDGIIIEGNTLILIEIKYGDSKLSLGQKIMLTRIADNWEGKAYIIHGTHSEYYTNTITEYTTTTEAIYTNGIWRKGNNRILKETLDEIINRNK